MDPHILPDLLVFLETANVGSITGAANRLNTVQSNVTARIKKLENSLGSPLFTRQARGIKLTTSGEAALAVAQRLNTVLNDLRFTFGQGNAPRRAKLRLGAIETVAASRLPALLGAFVKSYPQVEVTLLTGSSASLLDQVRSQGLDAVFVSRLPKIAGLRGNRVFEDELVVAVPPEIKNWSELRSRSGSALTVLVQRLGCSYTERLVDYLTEKAAAPNRMLEIGTLECILGLVGQGVGIAAIPRSFVDTVGLASKISCLTLPSRIGKLNIYLVAAARGDAATIVNEFVEFCGRTGRRAQRFGA